MPGSGYLVRDCHGEESATKPFRRDCFAKPRNDTIIYTIPLPKIHLSFTVYHNQIFLLDWYNPCGLCFFGFIFRVFRVFRGLSSYIL